MESFSTPGDKRKGEWEEGALPVKVAEFMQNRELLEGSSTLGRMQGSACRHLQGILLIHVDSFILRFEM